MHMQHKRGIECTGFFKFCCSSSLLLCAAKQQCSVSACTGGQIRCAYALTSVGIFQLCNAYRFVILVIGTVVYGRGDEQHVDAHKEQMAAAQPHPHWHGNTIFFCFCCLLCVFVSACAHCSAPILVFVLAALPVCIMLTWCW